MEKFSKRKNKQEQKTYIPKLSINTVDSLMMSLYSMNTMVNRAYYKRVSEFFSKLDINYYKDDWEVFIRLYIIKETIRLYLVEKVNDLSLIYEHIINNTSHKESVTDALDTIDEDITSNEDIEFLDNYVRDQLRFSFAYNNATPISELGQRILNDDYDNFNDLVNEFGEVIAEANYMFQKQRRRDEHENETFYLDSDDIASDFNETLTKINNPRNTIRTGIKDFNRMLNGGFKSKQFYCLFAAPSQWKSGLLFNIVLWGFKYNKVIPKDPTKKPLIIYLSLENSREQTLERLISYLFDNDMSTDKVNGEDIAKQMEADGFFINGVNFKFMYRASQTIDVNDIAQIIEDEKNENNNETVMIVIDYLRRMAPNRLNGRENADEYISLGDKADDLASLARLEDIPVVSASQLNRGADELIEKSVSDGTSDVGKYLGRSKVSDSRRIIDNIDGGYAINTEYNKEKDVYYLTINDIKRRGKNIGVSYLAHPFQPNNGMRLVEDVLLEASVSEKEVGSSSFTASGKRINRVEALTKSSDNKVRRHSNNRDFEEINSASNSLIFEDEN